MSTAKADDWIHEVKARPGFAAIGMILAHQGIVRGTSRSGESVRGMLLRADRGRLEDVLAEVGHGRASTPCAGGSTRGHSPLATTS